MALAEADARGERPLLAASALVLAVALVVGGTSRPLNDLLLLLTATPLTYLLVAQRGHQPVAWTGKLALALFLLAALQLVPLPPSIWTALPGRELAVASLESAGIGIGWRPLALDPGAAAMALATLIAPIALHIAVTRLSPRAIRRLLAMVALVAIASALIGVLQRVGSVPPIYSTEHAGASLGLFANRNHHADLLIAGMLLLPALVPQAQLKRYRLVLTAGVAVMGFAVLATTSRAGIALAIPATLGSLLAIWRPAPRHALWLVAGTLAIGLAILFVPAFGETLARFGLADTDQRLTIARDSLAATQAMWPAGSGYGSFVPVYMAYENLDTMEARYVVAAHNDFLQLALEGGLPGALTGFAGLAAVTVMAWRLYARGARGLAWAAWGVALVLLAHSAFDYPLRTGALAVLFGLCTGAAEKRAVRLPRHGGGG